MQSNVIRSASSFNPGTSEQSEDSLIGRILINSGKLASESEQLILRLQENESLRFGEAGVKLGLLKEEDVVFALACQYEYPYLLPGGGNLSTELIAAYEPFSDKVEVLRSLRSQLVLRWFGEKAEQRSLAIVGTGAGDGRSYLAANLAILFSQLGRRTLLIDGDLRKPKQHELFNLDNSFGLTSVLSKRGSVNDVYQVKGFPNLSVLQAGPSAPNPQELMGRAGFSSLIDVVSREFGVVLIDTPAAGDYADTHTIATHARGAMLVARKNSTRLHDASVLCADLNHFGVTMVGAVLNDF